MQTPDMKKLLQRKKFTGAELGKILLQNKAQEMERWKYGTAPKPALFNNEELQHMKAGLKTDNDRTIYNEYAHIYNLTSDLWNNSMADFNRLFVIYWKYTEYLKKIDSTEAAFWSLEKCPVIISRKDYEELAAHIVKADTEKKQEVAQYMAEMLYQWYRKHLDGAKLPADIKKALDKLKKQKCTNKRLLDNFSYDTKPSKWTDINGNEVDFELNEEVTLEKTMGSLKNAKKLKTESVEELAESLLDIEKQEDYISHKAGKEDSFEEHGERLKQVTENLKKPIDTRNMFWGSQLAWFGVECIERHYSFDCYGGNVNEAIEDAMRTNIGLHLFKNCVKVAPEKVEKLSKYEALEDIGRYFGWYDMQEEDTVPEIEFAAQLAEFAEDYPELYQLMLDKLADMMPEVKDMGFEALTQPFISIGELQEKGINMFNGMAEPTQAQLADAFSKDTIEGINKHYRVLHNGFAIVEGDTAKDPIEDVMKAAVIEEAMADKNQTRLYLDTYRKQTEDLFKKLHAHNALLGIICKLYDVEFLYNSASFPLKTFEAFDKCNVLQTPLLTSVYGHLYGNWEQIKKKLDFMQEVYPAAIFDAESKEYDPAEELVEQVENKLKAVLHTSKAHEMLATGTLLVNEMLGLSKDAAYGLAGGLHD